MHLPSCLSLFYICFAVLCLKMLKNHSYCQGHECLFTCLKKLINVYSSSVWNPPPHFLLKVMLVLGHFLSPAQQFPFHLWSDVFLWRVFENLTWPLWLECWTGPWEMGVQIPTGSWNSLGGPGQVTLRLTLPHKVVIGVKCRGGEPVYTHLQLIGRWGGDRHLTH